MDRNNQGGGNKRGNSADNRGGKYVPPNLRNSNSSSHGVGGYRLGGDGGGDPHYNRSYSDDRGNDRRQFHQPNYGPLHGGSSYRGGHRGGGHRLGGDRGGDRGYNRSQSDNQIDGRRNIQPDVRSRSLMTSPVVDDDKDKERYMFDHHDDRQLDGRVAPHSTNQLVDDSRRGGGRNADVWTKPLAKKEPDREGGSRLSMLSDLNPPVKFQDRLNTLKVKEAVTQGGQRIFLVVFITLFKGDLKDIKGFVCSQLPSNKQFKDSFTKQEQDTLAKGEYKSWDISLLFKLHQKVCGLNENVSEWKRFTQDTLEKRLDELKDLRNEMAHDIDCVLSKKERDEKLKELLNLSFEILSKLNEKKDIGDEVIRQYEVIEKIIQDVQKEVNESSDGNVQNAPTAQVMSKGVPAAASASSPAYGFASGSIASAFSFPAADSSKNVYAAAAGFADYPVAEGFGYDAASHGGYHYDGCEAMDVDDSFESTSWEDSIISQLKANILKYAGEGLIIV